HSSHNLAGSKSARKPRLPGPCMVPMIAACFSKEHAMVALANERVAYFNGKIVPENDVLIPFRDRGFMAGDAVFDTARTVRHKIFKLKEHIDRLYQSLRYIRVDPRISPKEMTGITEEVVARNLHLIDADDDYWVSQRISRGMDPADAVAGRGATPTVIVECRPLPLKQRARLFRDGIDGIGPAGRRPRP